MKFINILSSLAVLCGLFTLINPASAQIAIAWQKTSAATANGFRAVACSADGTKIVACDHGTVQISTNSGSTWSLTSASFDNITAPTRPITISADGTIIAVGTHSGAILVSVDGGATWTSRAFGGIWTGIACSTNGTKMVAVLANGQIYTSTDTGTNWTARDASRNWADVASSADGTKLVAVAGGLSATGQIYTSTDSGTNWAPRATAQAWTSVASSADGRKLVAVNTLDSFYGTSEEGNIYTSSDSGTNWSSPQLSSLPSAPGLDWTGVASAADGSHLVAISIRAFANLPGLIYTTTNSGASWQLASTPELSTTVLSCVASSADGTKLVATDGPTIYTYAAPSTNAPALNLTTGGGNAFVSWPWPSAGFVLQQNTNLATTNWVNVPGAPAVVNQMIPAPAGPNNFFRLVHP
jgi:hypothetical protein